MLFFVASPVNKLINLFKAAVLTNLAMSPSQFTSPKRLSNLALASFKFSYIKGISFLGE